MDARRADEKMALVLMSLPGSAAESVLAQLGPAQATRLRSEIERLIATPPPPEYAEAVLRELDHMLHSIYQRPLPAQPRIAPGTDRVPPPGTKSPRGQATDTARTTGKPTAFSGQQATGVDGSIEDGSDPITDLRATAPEKVAAALEGEHPSTAALVLSCLESNMAAEVLKRLPAEPRRNTFVWLRHPTTRNSELLPRIVRAVVQKSRVAEESPVCATGDAKFKKMAEMLRGLERTDRMEILSALEQQDSQTAARIKDLLYTFEDLLLIENRSMQKLLVEVDSKTLALALKDAAPEITDKVMANLSKRAGESLAEEISFLGLVPAAELQRAQKEIVDVIQRLDQAGELVMTQ